MELPSPRFLGIAILIVIVALFLRLATISNESVDGDELFSRRVAMSETPQALNLIGQDLVHPPLYYLLLKVTLPNDRPATALDVRRLSLTAGAASLVVVLLVGWVAAPLRGPAILAAFLLALNRTHIFYSQEARSYALFCFLAGALLLWFFLLDRHGHRWTYWLAGTTLMAALLYTHYFGAFYCAGVVLPIVLTNRWKRLGIRATASLALASAAFIPWVYRESAVYRDRSGLSANLEWQGRPTLYDLKMTFAYYLGLPEFRGATSLVFLIGAALIVVALLPDSRNKDEALDSRARIALAFTALMPPLLVFCLTRWPFSLPIFGERHMLPSIIPTLLLVCYGLWRLARRTSKPLRVLVIGALILSVCQAAPVWQHWPDPSREPYAAIADWLRGADLDFPAYTTWPYGVGEPVSFYLEGSRSIDELPSDPAKLPDRCIVLYRPAATREDAVVHSMLDQFDIIEEKYYSTRNSLWGTRALVLQKHKDTAPGKS